MRVGPLRIDWDWMPPGEWEFGYWRSGLGRRGWWVEVGPLWISWRI